METHKMHSRPPFPGQRTLFTAKLIEAATLPADKSG